MGLKQTDSYLHLLIKDVIDPDTILYEFTYSGVANYRIPQEGEFVSVDNRGPVRVHGIETDLTEGLSKQTVTVWVKV